MLSFLVSETECERSFAVERRQAANRPKMSVESRSDGLKIMLGGLDWHLRPPGQTVLPFFAAAQDMYATRCHG